METLEIEDLKILLKAVDKVVDHYEEQCYFNDLDSLEKSRAIIEQMIKDREFEQSQTTLPKL